MIERLLLLVAVAAALLLMSWGAMVLLARRLPPGLLRDLAQFLPACVTLVRRLRKNPDVPRRAKVAVVFAGLWVASPIDLIPEFLPVIGPLDDVVRVPREVLIDAWPGEPRLLERLIGAEPSP